LAGVTHNPIFFTDQLRYSRNAEIDLEHIQLVAADGASAVQTYLLVIIISFSAM
jgi:hypothetical protein